MYKGMVTPLDPKQVVFFKELLMSQVMQQEALIRLLVEKGIITKEELLEMVRVVNLEEAPDFRPGSREVYKFSRSWLPLG
jgi:hypothetical protein